MYSPARLQLLAAEKMGGVGAAVASGCRRRRGGGGAQADALEGRRRWGIRPNTAPTPFVRSICSVTVPHPTRHRSTEMDNEVRRHRRALLH